MRDQIQGRPFTGVFSSSDASALSEGNSRFTLYKVGGTSGITLAANERVVITDVSIDFSGATARTITIYDGADTTADPGELIATANLAQYGRHVQQLSVPHYGSAAQSYPKVKTSGAGQVDVVIRGVIQRDGQ